MAEQPSTPRDGDRDALLCLAIVMVDLMSDLVASGALKAESMDAKLDASKKMLIGITKTEDSASVLDFIQTFYKAGLKK